MSLIFLAFHISCHILQMATSNYQHLSFFALQPNYDCPMLAATTDDDDAGDDGDDDAGDDGDDGEEVVNC